MQYNLFKIKDKERLIDSLSQNNYLKSNKEIKLANSILTLYYSKRENNMISWQNVLNEFDIDVVVDKDNLKGVLIIEYLNAEYAVTYGQSSSIVQKYCDSDFAMDFAKRIKISKVKRKAAKFLNSTTNSLVRTLSNSDLIVVDKGESVVNLELVPNEEENLGKCIGIGKSIRINIDKDIYSIEEIVERVEEILNYNIKRPIPLFVKVKDQSLKVDIWEYLNTIFKDKIKESNFELDEMNILGSTIYFDDDFKLELKYKNVSKEIALLNSYEVKDFILNNKIEENRIMDYVKIKYSTDEFTFIKSLKEVITFDFDYENTQYVIFDGDVYYYNIDFENNIKEGLRYIDFASYSSEDDFSSDWYKDLLVKNNLVDVKEKDKNGKESTYREKEINNELAKRYNFDNLDRNLVDISKNYDFKIEVADLGKKDDILYSVKVGTPRDFCYAIDQSNLAIDTITSGDYIQNELIEEYKNVDKIGLWLYITGSDRIINEKNEIDMFNCKSVMFLSKLVDWAIKVKNANKTPVIRINKYQK